MTDPLKPQDHAERVAHFRAQLLGPLLVGELDRGALRAGLAELSQKLVRPPDSPLSRRYSKPTLERWYYRYRQGGVEALRPAPRRDRGAARALTKAQRKLLLDIRREYPRASAELILRTLASDGRLPANAPSAPTVRRLFAEHGLDRLTLRRTGKTGRVRRRWQAEAPGVLWHADVCHGPTLTSGDTKLPVRIHAILDDASRHIMAIEVCDNEREIEMLRLMVRALRRGPRPDALYLDNGSTYSGGTLATACPRLGMRLLHAKPYDPQARGKMERFWRTLRQGCLDYVGELSSLHDVRARVHAFVEQHYHCAPHASLMGLSPGQVWATHTRHELCLDENTLEKALTVRARRRIRGDGTLSIGGLEWEAAQSFIAGTTVTIARALLETQSAPWVEYKDRRYTLRPVDAVHNGRARRSKSHRTACGVDVPFDPASVLLALAVGRSPLELSR